MTAPRPGTAAVKLAPWVRLRMASVGVVVVALLGAVAYRAYGLQVRESDHYRELAQRQHIATVEVPAPRGVIYDATGAELAATANIDSIYADPQSIHDLGGTAQRLAALLGADVDEIEARLSLPRSFVWIERHVAPERARAVMAAGLEGVRLTPEPRRFYPGQGLAGPVLGFAGIDGRGLDGVELVMNQQLTGQRVSAEALRDASGTLMLPDGPVEPVPGASVTLTIDRFVQYTAERVLAATVEANEARAGVIVVMDVASGDVMAMANWPTFDPNRPGDAREHGARNRAVTDVYEIGSIMKVFSVAAAIDAGVVAPDTRIDVEGGKMRIGRKTIRDTHHDDFLTVGEVIKRSSNVGAAKIAQRLGREALRAALVRLGFGQDSGIELPGEQVGLVRPASRWGAIELATISFGYGLSATPLQVSAAMTAIANGGVYREPRVVREVRLPDGRLVPPRARETRRAVSAATAAAMRPILGSVFDGGKDGGTAHSLALPGFVAGGKTGTAHKIDPATHRYGDDLYLSSFAGFAPLHAPRVMVLVLIDEPRGKRHFGADVAGPAWLEVMIETLRYLGIPAGANAAAPSTPGEERPVAGKRPRAADAGEVAVVAEADGEPAAEADSLPIVGEGAPLEGDEEGDTVEMPDLSGLGMADALDVGGARCASMQVSGTGRVIEQFPPPGRQRRPAECRVVLSHESGPRPRSLP